MLVEDVCAKLAAHFVLQGFSFSQADDGQDLLADKLPGGVRIHAATLQK